MGNRTLSGQLIDWMLLKISKNDTIVHQVIVLAYF
jgi:hypothetical protein